MNQTSTLTAFRPALGLSTLAERWVTERLEMIAQGVLRIQSGSRTHLFGRPAADGLRAELTVHDERFWTSVLLGGTLGAAESFMDGHWSADDLTSVVRLFVRTRSSLESLESGAARLGFALARLHYGLRRNTRSGSRQNIADHYDLGNDFFSLMLDPTMSYSAAIFEPEELSLEAASIKKIDLLCAKLDLKPEDHLLEIGTGWGGFALRAASRFGCRVTTTTISKEQHAFARERIARAGLLDRVTLLDQDYRDLRGQYSKIVSVEMIEAVGAEYYDTFFSKCASLLEPGGKLALQAITIVDQVFDQAKVEADFIKRYIFPGSCIPSTTALLQSATRASDLRLRAHEDWTPHYARTLAAWRDNLAEHRDRVVARYGERFWRMWMFYLAYCEGGFREDYIGSVHMLFDRPRW